MAWTQVYDPMGGAVWSALVAGIPLISLFYMLAVRRAKGHYAARAYLNYTHVARKRISYGAQEISGRVAWATRC